MAETSRTWQLKQSHGCGHCFPICPLSNRINRPIDTKPIDLGANGTCQEGSNEEECETATFGQIPEKEFNQVAFERRACMARHGDDGGLCRGGRQQAGYSVRLVDG